MAINQALMLKKGSEAAGDAVDVVFSYVTGDYDAARDFRKLTENGIALRETTWQHISREDLAIANKYRGIDMRLDAPTYDYPADGTCDFLDCDFWHVISDRTLAPIAPVRPYSIFVTDCLQRYTPELFATVYEAGRHGTTRHAALILCSMPFNRDDIIQYVGVPARKVALFPLEFDPLPALATPFRARAVPSRPYFIWTTNASIHKNHATALRGIQKYFERFDGRFDVVATGVDTDKFDLKNEAQNATEYVRRIRTQVERSRVLTERITWAGNLDQDEYAWVLQNAKFLFHPTLIDAGTLSAAEASAFGVPTLSNDYPPMRFYDQRFNLGITFFDGTDENDIARTLKDAEANLADLKQRLPTSADLARFGVDAMAPVLWDLVRQHVQ